MNIFGFILIYKNLKEDDTDKIKSKNKNEKTLKLHIVLKIKNVVRNTKYKNYRDRNRNCYKIKIINMTKLPLHF